MERDGTQAVLLRWDTLVPSLECGKRSKMSTPKWESKWRTMYSWMAWRDASPLENSWGTKCRSGRDQLVHWCTCSLPPIFDGQESVFTQRYCDKSKQEIPKARRTLSQCPFHHAYLHANDCFSHLESEEWLLYPIMFKFNKSNDRNQNERTIPNPQPWQNEQVSSVCTHCKFLSVSTKN